ncbi:hypothetical protein LOZ66_005561 [Ophidiomyces ophidiicola]|nr:hypothetical protein LOZ66_005561 [Ophidiomyces ophidiicola]
MGSSSNDSQRTSSATPTMMERVLDSAWEKAPPQPSVPSPSAICTPSAPPARPVVRFLEPSVVTLVENSSFRKRNYIKMAKQVYETFSQDEVTDNMMEGAAKFFSENYGTWGANSHSPGKPVKLSARRLRQQYLSSPSASYHAVTVDGNLAGNAFSCRWKQGGRNVCWVTQLVVDKNYRERGLAGGLLRSLRLEADDVYASIEKVALEFARQNAKSIMQASPISYIREAKLCGTLFDPQDSTGIVCGVNTGFFVDHDEPLEALELVQENWEWPLGELPDGYEFLLILPGKHRRSRSRSSSKPGRDTLSSQ